MKAPLALIKTWFETGDKPTQQQFHDAFDSFYHKDSGAIIVGKTIQDNGDVIFNFSDNSQITIERFVQDVSQPISYINGLQEALATIQQEIITLQTTKVNIQEGKALSTNDFTTALKDKLEQLELPVLSIANANGETQFTINLLNEKLALRGGTFNVENKLFSVDPLQAFITYIDVDKGNDVNGQPNNQNRPFRTDTAAYKAIPDDGNVWNLVYLDSSDRFLSVPPRSVIISSRNRGTFYFRNLNVANITNIPYFEIDAIRSDLVVEDTTVRTGVRPQFLKLNLKNITLRGTLHSGNFGVFGGDRDANFDVGYIKCDTFFVDSCPANVRVFNYAGDFICNHFKSNSVGMSLGDNGTHNLRFKPERIEALGTLLRIGGVSVSNGGHKIKAYLGDAPIEDIVSDILDVSGVLFTCPSFYYRRGGVVTGLMGNLDYAIRVAVYNFVGFTGKLVNRGSVTAGMNIRHSTIYVDTFLQSIGNHISLEAQEFVFDNLNLYQNTPGPIFGNIDESFTINIIGTFNTNAPELTSANPSIGSSANIVVEHLTPNSF